MQSHYCHLTEKADLSKFPTPLSEEPILGTYTLGDLHGNPMKLIYVGIRIGLIKNLSEEAYYQLYNICYNKNFDLDCPNENTVTGLDIAIFKSIIVNMRIHANIKLHLLGDEVHDRGPCDLYTLFIFERMKGKETVVINYSNHGLEFIKNVLKKSRFDKGNIRSDQRRSSTNLQKLIDFGLIERETVDSLIQDAYLPKLKLISIKKQDKLICISTHAPIGIKAIKHVLVSMNVADERKMESLLGFLAAINNLNHMVHEQMMKRPATFLTDLKKWKVITNNTSPEHYRDRETNAFPNSGALVFYANGHADSRGHICLDNMFAKQSENIPGKLTLLIHPNNDTSLQLLASMPGIERLVIQSDSQFVLPKPKAAHTDITIPTSIAPFSSTLFFANLPKVLRILKMDTGVKDQYQEKLEQTKHRD